ncbi:MAG: adenylate/guanylate cyclase domain-containing protein [Sphingobacteriales bacterium]|nr:MAG: adenylate/guanylate cyclase domain-containing protein [Sphingobacteriales bacterium]
MMAFLGLNKKFSFLTKYRYKWVFIIAVCWTLIDVISWVRFMHKPYDERTDTVYQFFTPGALILRALIDFVVSIFMGNLLVFRLKGLFRDYPLLVSFIMKTLILIIASFLMNFLVHITYSLWTLHLTFQQSYINFKGEVLHRAWLFDKMTTWFLIFLFTQLLIEINEKYSPGVFLDILLGKYIQPKIEKRIIMFLDLKDSTPIAEQLGHKVYFRFIRDFIYSISMAILENDGRIYQYVGDEVVVSWRYSDENAMRCIQAVISARRAIQRRSEEFRRLYGIIPEFKVGIHVGDVTVGEIGIIKKDLAMSGDTMNTTARIRTACTELNHKFIASKDFVDHLNLKDWQAEPLGEIDLKGKAAGIELFALKI